MGGVSSVLKPIADAYEGSLGEQALKVMRSSEGEMMKSEAGKWIKEQFDQFMPAVKRDAQAFHTPTPIPPGASSAQAKVIADSNATDMRNAMSLAHKMNETKYFGPNRAYLSQAIKLANVQRNPIHAQNLADNISIIFREHHPQQFRVGTGSGAVSTDWRKQAGVLSDSPYTGFNDTAKFEQSVKNFLSYTYLGRVAIPHTMQHLNTLLTDGISAYSKAWLDMASDFDSALKYTKSTGALFEEDYRAMKDIADGKDTMWHKIFHMPGFSKVRQMEIIHSAIAGKYAAEEALKSGGNKGDLQLKMLGIDPTAARQRGSLTPDEILTAGYRSADENLFIDRGLKTPATWDSGPLSRFLTLYKGFSFRQGKFIKDTIARSFKASPIDGMKTLVILGTAFPIAGEIVASMENVVTGRNIFDRHNEDHWSAHNKDLRDVIKDPTYNKVLDEYIEAMGHVAGFGMNYSIARAASRNAVAQYMIGPAFSLAADEIQGATMAAKGKPKTLVKQNLRKIPVVGPAIVGHYEDAVKYFNNIIEEN